MSTPTYTRLLPAHLHRHQVVRFSGYTRPKARRLPEQAHDAVNGAGKLPAAPLPTVLTIPEACEVLRISKWTLYQLIRSRQLTTIKLNSRRVVPVTAISALIQRLTDEEAA